MNQQHTKKLKRLNMKTTMNMWKAGLVGLFLLNGIGAMGQSTPAATQTPPTPLAQLGPINTTTTGSEARATLFATEIPALDFANELTNAILFYNPTSGSGLTLVASEREDHEDDRDLPFTSYKWFYMGQDPAAVTDDISTAIEFNLGGTNVPAAGLEQSVAVPPGTHPAHKLPITNLTPGYHIFKVQGIVNPDGATPAELCEVETETIVIYVLPPLNIINATGSSTGSSFQFCEADASTADPANGQNIVSVSAEVAFTAAPTHTPAVADFEKRYRWYAIKKDGNGDYHEFTDANRDALPTSITGVTLLNDPGALTVSNQGDEIPAFFPQIEEFGQYKILLEVEYTVKDRQFGTAGDAGNTRVRPHTIYRTYIQDGVNDLVITVTPQPGKPHITIEAVND